MREQYVVRLLLLRGRRLGRLPSDDTRRRRGRVRRRLQYDGRTRDGRAAYRSRRNQDHGAAAIIERPARSEILMGKLIALALVMTASAAAAELRAGVAKADLDPPVGAPMVGYGSARFAT